MERKEPLSSKSSKKQQSLKKSVQETLRRSSRNKKDAYKRINLSDNSSSDENLNTTSYAHENGGHNRHKKSPKNLEKDRQKSSAKSLKKQHSSKKTVGETSLRTRSSIRNAYKRVDVCEASSSNELTANTSKVHRDSLHSCTASESLLKEANRSLKQRSDKVKTSRDYQRIPDLKESSSADSDTVGNKNDSSVDFNLDLSKKDSELSEFGAKGDDRLKNDDKDPSAPETLSDKTNLTENFTPFRYWGKGASRSNETLKQSEGDEEHKKKDASARFVPTPEKSYDPKKDWEKYSARAAFRKEIENKKELRWGKIDNVMNADKKEAA